MMGAEVAVVVGDVDGDVGIGGAKPPKGEVDICGWGKLKWIIIVIVSYEALVACFDGHVRCRRT